jgi:hypothetical protein
LVLFYKKELLAFYCLPHRPGGSGKSHSHRNLVLERALMPLLPDRRTVLPFIAIEPAGRPVTEATLATDCPGLSRKAVDSRDCPDRQLKQDRI